MTGGTDERLTTAEMARFCARGYLVFESVVPDDINAAALELFAETAPVDLRRDKPRSGTPLDELYPDPSPIGAMLRQFNNPDNGTPASRIVKFQAA